MNKQNVPRSNSDVFALAENVALPNMMHHPAAGGATHYQASSTTSVPNAVDRKRAIAILDEVLELIHQDEDNDCSDVDDHGHITSSTPSSS
jgi:hypothetical protein